jgi:ferric-dicitrate binding protein FerR (iron transport regulator)
MGGNNRVKPSGGKEETANIAVMKPSTPWRRIPWRSIALALAGAAVVAWAIGFVTGLLVQFGVGIGR